MQVRSLTLDVKVWDEAVLGMMERIGNEVANEAWEAELLNETARSVFAQTTMRVSLCLTTVCVSWLALLAWR